MTYVGIDLHANNMVNVAINGNGEVVREAKVPGATEEVRYDIEGYRKRRSEQ